MGTPVKDRSGRGLPPKAERRALGKAAARKRAAARRRRELLRRIMRIAGPIVVVGAIIGAFWLFSDGDGETTATPTAGATSTPTPPASTWTSTWTLPAGLDPRLATKPEVTAGEGTLSELQVTTLIEGTGAPLAAGQTVSVNYVGVYYATGEEFDSSWKRGEPFEFTLGVGGVIQGWDQGLAGVPIGSRVQLDVPSHLGYNDGQDRRFVVDILSAS